MHALVNSLLGAVSWNAFQPQWGLVVVLGHGASPRLFKRVATFMGILVFTGSLNPFQYRLITKSLEMTLFWIFCV